MSGDKMISVIIPSFNRKELMLQAVNSVLNQTLNKDEYEIIVVKNYKDYDDLLKEKGVKTYYIENPWLSAKISKGIEESQGDIICFLDDDDLFKPTKLQRVKDIFEKYNVSWYKNLIEAQDLNGNILDYTCLYNSTVLKYFRNGGLIDKKSLLKIKNPEAYLTLSVNNSTQCVKRDIAMLFKDKIIKAERAIDELIFFFSFKYGDLFYIDKEPLTIYRFHTNNISHYNFKFKEDLTRYVSDFYKVLKSYENIMEYFSDDPELKQIVQARYFKTFLYTRIYDVFSTEKISMRKTIRELISNISLLRYKKIFTLSVIALLPSIIRKNIIKIKYKLS